MDGDALRPHRHLALIREGDTATALDYGGSGGGGKGPTAISSANQALISGIMGGLPGERMYNFNEAGLREYEANVALFAASRKSISRDLAELGLAMADLDARGLEETETYREKEERVAALRDALSRIDLVEELRLDPFKDAMRKVADAVDEVTEAQKRQREEMVQAQKAAIQAAQGPNLQEAFSRFGSGGAGYQFSGTLANGLGLGVSGSAASRDEATNLLMAAIIRAGGGSDEAYRIAHQPGSILGGTVKLELSSDLVIPGQP